MARRTTSVYWTAKPTFKLDRYANPPPDNDNTTITGLTVVPIPGKTAEFPDADGPAMWLQVDVDTTADKDLGNGWTLRFRGQIDSGFRIPLSDVAALVHGQVGAGGAGEIELGKDPPPAAPTPTASSGGANGGVDLSYGGLALIAFCGGGITTAGFGPNDIGVGFRATKVRLSITPGSAVLGALVRQSFTTSLDIGVLVSTSGGIVIEGGSSLDLFLAVRKSIGNGWLGATLSYIRLSGIFEQDAGATKLGAQATFGIELSFLRATLIIDGLGAGLFAKTHQPGGNLLGLGDIEADAITPTGLGLKIDWGPVKGGGFFSYDQKLDRYAGALQLNLGSWSLSGVAFCEPRNANPLIGPRGGTTMLVTVGLTQNVPSPTFTISGIGLLVGLHRRTPAAATDARRATDRRDRRADVSQRSTRSYDAARGRAGDDVSAGV